MDFKPIETEYKGYRFRSRLEARWAVFFDAIGIEYEYEPEGFLGIDNTPYLPDFRIKYREESVYAEVKGNDAQLEKDYRKIACAIDYGATPVSDGLIILGEIPDPSKIRWGNVPIFSYLFHHEKYILCTYASFIQKGQSIVLALGEKSIKGHLFAYDCDYSSEASKKPNIVQCKCKWSMDNLCSWKQDKLQSAYISARSARFEHGEKPCFDTPSTDELVPF